MSSEWVSPPQQFAAPKRSRRRRIALVVSLALVAGWLASTFAVTYLLTHRAKRPFAELPHSMQIDSVRLKSSDGTELGAWVTAPQNGRPVVVLLHGLHANRSAHRNQMRAFAQMGYGAVAITLRAHGDSGGEKIAFGLAEAGDVKAAVAFVEQEFPGHRIILFGESLGAAAAIFAASDLHGRIAGYILDTPYIDLKSALFNRLSMYLPPVFSHAAYSGMRLWAPVFLDRPMNDYAPINRIGDISPETPVLFIAGEIDTHATLEQSTKLAKRCAHARFEVIAGAAHGQTYSRNPQRYEQLLREFIDTLTIR